MEPKSMTQEELDALMSGETDFDSVELDEETVEETTPPPANSNDDQAFDENKYDINTNDRWPPPPPIKDNKMVDQLDDVTRESEEKATQIFDIIEDISNGLMEAEERVVVINETLENNIATLEKLLVKFPQIQTFAEQLEANKKAKELSDAQIEMMQDNGDQIMTVMDIMQYQDIHRQKIERVINVMRALSRYMNDLFSAQMDDSKRVSSATHLPGDSIEDLVENDEIEALLASFGA
jgi:methyl-accepting chemotaxis protein